MTRKKEVTRPLGQLGACEMRVLQFTRGTPIALQRQLIRSLADISRRLEGVQAYHAEYDDHLDCWFEQIYWRPSDEPKTLFCSDAIAAAIRAHVKRVG